MNVEKFVEKSIDPLQISAEVPAGDWIVMAIDDEMKN